MIKLGNPMKVGDLVLRHRAGRNPVSGIILELHLRSIEHYPQERIDKDPVRTIKVLCSDGKINRWYTTHVEVIQ